MTYLNKKIYVIINTEDITDSMIEASLNDSDTLRYTADGSRAILKFNTKFPDVMKSYKKHTHDEILIQLRKPEWNQMI